MHFAQHTSVSNIEEQIPGDDLPAFVRVLVLDDNHETVAAMENALWIWPHRISSVASVEDAERLCRHLTPSALVVATDSTDKSIAGAIPDLRRRLPQVPIIALASGQHAAMPGRFLDQGADAILPREDAHRPTLHTLLTRLQRRSGSSPGNVRSHVPTLGSYWQNSEMLGALICDISGSVVAANSYLADLLGYADSNALTGLSVRRDLLRKAEDWADWSEVAGDADAIFRHCCAFRTANGQMLWMQTEVCAAPGNPNFLQVVCLDRTEMAILTGRRD